MESYHKRTTGRFYKWIISLFVISSCLLFIKAVPEDDPGGKEILPQHIESSVALSSEQIEGHNLWSNRGIDDSHPLQYDGDEGEDSKELEEDTATPNGSIKGNRGIDDLHPLGDEGEDSNLLEEDTATPNGSIKGNRGIDDLHPLQYNGDDGEDSKELEEDSATPNGSIKGIEDVERNSQTLREAGGRTLNNLVLSNQNRDFDNLDNNDDGTNTDYLTINSHQSPIAYGDDTLETSEPQQSSLVNRFIDKFITNYGENSKRNLDINVAEYKNKSGLSPPLMINDTRAMSKIRCGGVLTLNDDSPQIIESPNYPEDYPNNADCVWTIITQQLTDFDMVKVTILDFDLETGNCDNDYLSFTDHGIGRSKTLCGEEYDPMITSMSNSMTINFVTDDFITQKGFKLEVRGFSSSCGGYYEVNGNESFTFQTPFYPGEYPEGSRCHWLISSQNLMSLELINYYGKTPIENMITITTKSFTELQPYDTQKIYVSKVFSIMFIDDVMRTMDEYHPGAQFQAFPAKKIKRCNAALDMEANSTVIINTKDYPEGYEDNAQCRWKLSHKLGDGYMLKIRFIHFDIEDHTECDFDFFSILDESQNVTYTYCGQEQHSVYKTMSKEIALYFISDAFNVDKHAGFSISAKVEKVMLNTCTMTKRGRNVWVVKSPSLPYVFPSYTICNLDLEVKRTDRFKIIFKKFNLRKSESCKNSDHLSITDLYMNSTEYFCGNMEGRSFISSGNDLKIMFSSDSHDYGEEFEIEIKAFLPSNCGGNIVMDPGTHVDLRVPNKNLELECVWVIQGKNSTLALSFRRASDISVASSGLYKDLFSYNARTLNFIDPSDKYMIMSAEARAVIRVNAYETYSKCGTEYDVRREPVLITNQGVETCPITLKRPQNKQQQLAIRYTMLSWPETPCPLRVFDVEEGKSAKLCSSDWRKTHTTSSTEFAIEAVFSQSKIINNYMVLINPIKFSCGEMYNVKDDKIILRSKAFDRKKTCVFRFKSDGNRISLDIATSMKRSLNYISVSVDGSFQTLKKLSDESNISQVTRKEFLVVIDPFPKTVSFIMHIMKDMPKTDSCNTCIVVRPGSQGTIVSPHSKGSIRYPAGLNCDVKFEGKGQNRTVILEFQKLDIPLNTSLDTLKIVKDSAENIVEPSQIPPLPFTSLIDTPFSIQFKTQSHNEYNGYKIAYTVYECGGLIMLKDDSTIIIESPGYGNLYPTYTKCVWHIETNITNISDRIRMEILNFKIHSSDSLDIIDPFYDSEPIASLTGTVHTSVFISTGNQLRVIFTSDSRKVREGFRFKIKAILSGCGGDIDTGKVGKGNISTINFFPNIDYCLFRLRPAGGRVLLLEPKRKNGMKNVLQFPVRRRGPNNKIHISDGDACEKGVVIMSARTFLSQGEVYCAEEPLPVITTTKNILLLIKSPAYPPLEFKFTAGVCGGELTSENPRGSISSPNHPQVFNGPVICTWMSRSAVLIEVTYLDLLPGSDSLNLTDAQHNISLTATQYPHHALMDINSTITFTGVSEGMRTGFKLDYEFVDHQGVWNVAIGKPAMIIGWPGTQNRPSAWQVLGPKGGKGFTIMVWGAYIPSDSDCSVHFLLVSGVNEVGQRVCGGTGLRTIHVYGREAILVLHTTSPLAVLAASVHLMV